MMKSDLTKVDQPHQTLQRSSFVSELHLSVYDIVSNRKRGKVTGVKSSNTEATTA